MKLLIKSKSKNYLVVITIGSKYYSNWKKKIFPMIKEYSVLNGIGVIAITEDLLEKNSKYYKKPQWQKLLGGEYIKKKKIDYDSLCIIDGDILVNPFSPNIFKVHKKNMISVVSSRIDMPYDYDQTSRKIAFYRNKYYSKKYPLNSAMNMSIKDIFKYHNLKSFNNFFCAGLYMFSKNYSKFMEKIFYKYERNIKSITNGGDQTHVNYEFQNKGLINWIDYKYQAIWNYEMANYYPFLYYEKKKEIINYCIEASLLNNYFLHFAGSWHESKLIDNYNEKIIRNKKKFISLKYYLNKKFKGKASGLIKP